MSTVLPPSATALTLPSGGAPVVVTAMGDAKALAALQAGATLEVVTLGRASKGVLEVMTTDGLLQLKVQPPATLPPIPEGARLTLQVGNGGALNMLAVNGRPLAGAVLAQGAPTLPGSPQATSSPQAGASPATSQNTAAPEAAPVAGTPSPAAAPVGLTATVIRPAMVPGAAPTPQAMPAAPPPALPPDLPAGTRLTVRIAGIEPPPALPEMAAPRLAPAPATPSVAQHGRPQGPLPAMPASLPGGGASPVPGAAVPAAAVPVLSGTVTAHPPGGQAVLSTAIGTLALPTAEPVELGSVVRLEVVAPPQVPASATVAAAAPRPEGLTAQGWPALTEAMKTLARNDPQALELMMRAIPAAGPRLAAAMASFSGAMKSGDGRGVVGEVASKALEKAGRRDLVDRLQADLAELAQQSGREVGGGEWRMHSLPFVHGAQVDPIHLFVRGAESEAEKRRAGGTGSDNRFILDFHLSNLGRLQLDGLVRREDKLFDLIVRTGVALPQEMRMDIMAIFTQASELVGTKGSVAFQSGGRWVEIRTDEAGPTRIEA